MKLFTFILIVSAMTGSSATLFNKFDTSHCKCIPKNYPCTQKGYRINFNYARTPSACLPNLFLCCDEGKNKWFMNSKEKLSNKIQKKINSTFNGLQKSASEVNTKTSTEKELTLFHDSQTKNSSNQKKFTHSPQTTKKETPTPDPKLIDKILNKIPKFNYVATLPAIKILENVTRNLSENKEFGPNFQIKTNYISPRNNSSNFTVDLSESNFIKSNSASRNRVIDKVLYRNIHDVTLKNKPNAENKPQNYYKSLYSNNFPTNHTTKSMQFVKLIENEAPIPHYTDEPHEQPLKSDIKYEKGFMEYVTHSSIMPKMQTIDQSFSSKNIINDVSLEVIESNRLQNSKINEDIIHDSTLIGKKEDAVTKLQRNLHTGHLAPNTQSTKQEDITPAIPIIEQLGKVVMIPSIKSQAEEATLPKLKSQAEEVSIHSVTKPEVAISNVTSLTEVTIPSVPTETEEAMISTITAIIEVTIPSDTAETEESTIPSVTTMTEEVAILSATIVTEEGTIPSGTATEEATIPSVPTATEEAAISTITTVTEVTLPSDTTETEENIIPSVTTVTEEATISTITIEIEEATIQSVPTATEEATIQSVPTATEEATIQSVPTATEEATIPTMTTVTEEIKIQSGTTVTEEGTLLSDTTVAEEMKTSSDPALTEVAIPSVTQLSEVVTIFPKGMQSSAKLNGEEIALSNVTQASEEESHTQTYTTESTNSTFQENKTETFPFKAIGPHTTKLSKFIVYPRSKDTPNLLRVYNESVDELISFSKKFQIPSRISNSVANRSLQATTTLEIDVVQTATKANTTKSDGSNTTSINNLLAESNQTMERKKKVTNSLLITTDKSSVTSKDLNESRRKLPSGDLSAVKNINATVTHESTKPPQIKQNQSESIFNWIFKIF